jgi:hypothetical protein
MIQTIITPLKKNIDISVAIPDDYVGKQIHVLIYKDEEVKNATTVSTPKKKPSDFFGTMTREEGEKMKEYVTKSRQEWERNI